MWTTTRPTLRHCRPPPIMCINSMVVMQRPASPLQSCPLPPACCPSPRSTPTAAVCHRPTGYGVSKGVLQIRTGAAGWVSGLHADRIRSRVHVVVGSKRMALLTALIG
jgi:hypothetical protein